MDIIIDSNNQSRLYRIDNYNNLDNLDNYNNLSGDRRLIVKCSNSLY